MLPSHPAGHPHPALTRLDELAASLAVRGDVVGVLGLGSAGVELDRFDDHSDLDVFVVVDEGGKEGYLADPRWLDAPAPVAWSFANDPNGRKVLYADGVFVELAVFTLQELTRLPFCGARVVWQRHDAPTDLATCAPPPPLATSLDTVDFHLGEALTNLYVGLHRELRGEHLTAMRFIQVHAVDRALALLRLTAEAPGHRRDAFDATRRVELDHSSDQLPLAEMIPGYAANGAAAGGTLRWLRSRFTVDVAIGAALDELLARMDARSPEPTVADPHTPHGLRGTVAPAP